WTTICRLINDADYLKRQLVRLQTEDVTTANLNAIDTRLAAVATEISNYLAAITDARKPSLGVKEQYGEAWGGRRSSPASDARDSVAVSPGSGGRPSPEASLVGGQV